MIKVVMICAILSMNLWIMENLRNTFCILWPTFPAPFINQCEINTYVAKTFPFLRFITFDTGYKSKSLLYKIKKHIFLSFILKEIKIGGVSLAHILVGEAEYRSQNGIFPIFSNVVSPGEMRDWSTCLLSIN